MKYIYKDTDGEKRWYNVLNLNVLGIFSLLVENMHMDWSLAF
jgi:hypothetical protein